ncbi:Transcription factor mst12 [Ciborinia camelliae]|nr:Transcription factor mst12 [Ciborinia camelliae]
MAHMMYSASMAPPQKPETFMLSSEAQQSLPQDAQVALQQVDNLKYFLISAPVDWSPDQYIRRFLLPTGEYVSCVLWNNLFHISGTDIVRCLSFRFQAFGRPVKNSKKFEEGIFSDLRNLKSGTDASLEEPKSGFLDFLYKNNCIRTQKKQKVFYWYSVPHDRLFLDALERDLKREKMGQEATTVAVNEPALSFEFDSSQSLFEQLTKSQQANSSSLSAQQPSYNQSQSTSPVMRAMESMPPPQMMPQVMAMPEDMNQMAAYQQMTMQQPQMQSHMQPQMQSQMQPQQQQPQQHQQMQQIKRESDFNRVQYNQNGVPIGQTHQRHSSMPAYALEFSPAPSFVSSHYEDYTARAISFEPITPPQQALGMGAEPAYIANEETGLYTAIPDHMGGINGLHTMMQLPPSNLSGPQFSHATRGYGSNNVYSVIEGSPTYKQRRRRSSIPPGVASIIASGASAGQHSHPAHRPSDLRRSVSHSVGPVAEGDESGENSPPGLTFSNQIPHQMTHHKELIDFSRHGTPLSTVEDSPHMNPMSLRQSDFQLNNNDLSGDSPLDHSPQQRLMQGSGGVVRRARSATMMELGPYPQKSHSCPIPTCGRVFKRLEHLKRHRRTHDRGDGSEGAYGSYSGEEDFEGEDHLGSLEESSPNSENGYLQPSMTSMSQSMTSIQPSMTSNFNNMSMPMSMGMSSDMTAPSQLINAQLMHQPIQ